MDRLSRLRAPLAVTALVALTLVALAPGRAGGLRARGRRRVHRGAAARLAPNGGDGALTLLAGVLVVWCFAATEVPGRRGFAVWGVALAAVSLAASVAALALTDLEIAGWSVVWLVPDLVVPALVGVALGVLATWEPVDAPEEVPEPAAAPPVPTPDPALAPSWPEDEAAGAVWRTAGEAAQGAPASGWGTGSATPWSRPALPPGRATSSPLPEPRTRAPAPTGKLVGDRAPAPVPLPPATSFLGRGSGRGGTRQGSRREATPRGVSAGDAHPREGPDKVLVGQNAGDPSVSSVTSVTRGRHAVTGHSCRRHRY